MHMADAVAYRPVPVRPATGCRPPCRHCKAWPSMPKGNALACNLFFQVLFCPRERVQFPTKKVHMPIPSTDKSSQNYCGPRARQPQWNCSSFRCRRQLSKSTGTECPKTGQVACSFGENLKSLRFLGMVQPKDKVFVVCTWGFWFQVSTFQG